jgi:hypothetical protein
MGMVEEARRWSWRWRWWWWREVIDEWWRKSSDSWRRIHRDVAPPDLDERRPIVEVGSSRATSASQEPYSSSPGAGSQGRRFRRPRPVVDAHKHSGWKNYGGSATARRGKNLCSIGCVFVWLIGCLYSPVQGDLVSRSWSKLFMTLQLEGKETKTKNCKKRPRPRKPRNWILADHFM